MLEKETNKRVVRDAIGIVIKLNENGFINTDDEESFEGFCKWMIKASALTFAYYYGYKEYDNEIVFFKDNLVNFEDEYTSVSYFRDIIERVRGVYEYYNYNYSDDNLWTLTAFLWQNEIGEEYAMSIYERECLDDPYYQRMGKLIKRIIEKKEN